MVLLALIPAAALVLIVVVCLSAKQRFLTRFEQIKLQSEHLRQQKLQADTTNDQQLISSIVRGKHALGDCFQQYSQTRQSILPELKRKSPSHWTNDDLTNFIKRWLYALSVKVSRKLIFQTTLSVLGIIAVAGGLAAWRYSALSEDTSPTAHTVSNSITTDPFAVK